MNLGKNKAVKAGLGYTIGNIFIKGIGFLALPLFSRLMTTEEFGVFNVFISYDAILFIIIGLAMHSSLRSAKYRFENQIDQYTSSISLIYLFTSITLILIARLFQETLSKLLDFTPAVLYMLIIYSFGTAILTLYNTRISLDYSYKKYLIVAGINSIGNVAISLLFVLTIFRNDRALGRIFGSSLTIFVLAVVLLVLFYRQAHPRFQKDYWKFAIRYSLPVIPHGISQVLLAQFDRVMIRTIDGNSQAGIYSLAGNIMLILTVITDSVSSSWNTWFYEQMNKGRHTKIQTSASQIVMLFTVLSVGLIGISPEMIWILGGDAYESAKYISIPMIISAFFIFMYNIVVPSEYYTQKTVYIMIGTMLAAVINLVTNYIFIHKYGYLAAAYTTLFSYICYLVLHLIISYHLVKFNIIPIRKILLFTVIVVVSAVISLIFIHMIWIRYIVTLCIVAPLSVILLKQAKK